MAQYRKDMSEGELLQALLESVDNEVAFMIGQVMGIMRKGDAIHIEKLVKHIDGLKEQVRSLSMELNNAEEREKKA